LSRVDQEVIVMWWPKVFSVQLSREGRRGRDHTVVYNYLCNQCLSPLKLWDRPPFIARCTRYRIRW